MVAERPTSGPAASAAQNGAMPTPAQQVGEERFRLREVALTAYGPTIVNATGHGAVAPVLALRARELGADVGTAALVVGLLGVGMLLASLPAGALVARVGERRTLFGCGLLDAVIMLAAAASGSVLLLAVAVTASGATWTAFLLARQGFMIDAVPFHQRARALAALGGSHRVGLLVGPLLGAGVIHLGGLRWVFVLAAVTSAASGLMALLMPDLGSERRRPGSTQLSVWTVLRAHRRTLLTLGSAVVVLSASRSVRTSLLPLWADHVGIAASTTSLIFALAAAVDIAMFYPGGWVMDHHGRTLVAVPVVLTVAVGSLLLPLTEAAWSVALVVGLIALGNGLGSGIVMTLGADSAPTEGRAQFLGGWRLCGDVGLSGGPLLISAVASAAPLAAACVVVGGVGLLGTAWVGYWTRRADLARLSRR